MNFWLSLIMWIAIGIWPTLGLAQTVTLTAIDKNPQAHAWTLRFMSATPVKIHQFILSSPDRLVLDITGAQNFQNRLSATALINTPIKQVRSSAQSSQNLRIVLDLKAKLPPSAINITFSVQNQISLVKNPQAQPETVISHDRPREIIIVIDPGHGGKDPGATGVHRIHEKNIVLSIARKLQILINQQPGFKAVLTRNGDYYLTLRQRLAIARQNKADMFIAIHADAYPDPLAHGVSVFALSQRGATSEAARWLAARENQSELMGGVDLTDKGNVLRSVLINLSQTATIQASLLIGQNLLDDIHNFAHLHHNQVEQAAFVVLKSPDIPSLLLETGFVSNNKEEVKLSNLDYQYNLAHAMMLGIKQYFLKRPPPDTWLAMHSKNK